MSSHGGSLSSKPKKPLTVSGLFPNTTEAIERERASAAAMDPRERARLESWWRRQLMTEDQVPTQTPPTAPCGLLDSLSASLNLPGARS